MLNRFLLTILLIIGPVLGLNTSGLAQTAPLGTQVTPAGQTATSGTLTLAYQWHWDASYPGTVTPGGDIPPKNATVTGVRIASTPTGSNITVENIQLYRGSSLPVQMYPGLGYTGLFNGFGVTDQRWTAVATLTSLQTSSVLNMTLNISWTVPQSSPPPPPPPPPPPQPLAIRCSQSASVHLKYGQEYKNYCNTSGGLDNGTRYWSTPAGVPPGLNTSSFDNFSLDFIGVPAGGVYTYSVRVTDTKDTVTSTFTVSVDPPVKKTTPDGILSVPISILLE